MKIPYKEKKGGGQKKEENYWYRYWLIDKPIMDLEANVPACNIYFSLTSGDIPQHTVLLVILPLVLSVCLGRRNKEQMTVDTQFCDDISTVLCFRLTFANLHEDRQ